LTLLEKHPDAPVVIDEANVDFGAETAIPPVASHSNLLVVQTMSKSRALAGLLTGYGIGDAALDLPGFSSRQPSLIKGPRWFSDWYVATAGGLDFSGAAPNVAQRLFDLTGLKADGWRPGARTWWSRHVPICYVDTLMACRRWMRRSPCANET
jgi:aminotransferase class I and II